MEVVKVGLLVAGTQSLLGESQPKDIEQETIREQIN
jgi:hypothetical protein